MRTYEVENPAYGIETPPDEVDRRSHDLPTRGDGLVTPTCALDPHGERVSPHEDRFSLPSIR